MHIGHGRDLNENTKLANMNLSKFNCFIFSFIMWDRLQEKISIAIQLLQQKETLVAIGTYLLCEVIFLFLFFAIGTWKH